MSYLVLDKLGWPIERIHGKPIQYALRCLIRGREIISRDKWNDREAVRRIVKSCAMREESQ